MTNLDSLRSLQKRIREDSAASLRRDASHSNPEEHEPIYLDLLSSNVINTTQSVSRKMATKQPRIKNEPDTEICQNTDKHQRDMRQGCAWNV